MATVELEKVEKLYGETRAIDGVSIEIGSGEFLTLLGPSGCGKTTTLRAVAGLVKPDAGAIRIAGEDVTPIPTHKRNIGMVFQSHALFPHMTVGQNVGFGLKMRHVDTAERGRRIAQALDLVRLPDYGARYPNQLSGGQQQRVALARALVINPHVLLLDEPFGALDRKLREAMQAELRDLTRRIGITAVFVTHDQEEALILSDRVAVMNAGRIEQIGSPSAVFERPETRFVADFMGVGNFLEARVTGRTGETVTLDAGGILLETGAASTLAVGDRIDAAIRAERIVISDAAGAGPNRAAGSVRSAVYHGTMSTYEIRLDGQEDRLLIVREPSAGGEVRYGAGARVGLAWDASAVRLLRR